MSHGAGHRLSDAQVMALRAHYEETGRVADFVRDHPDWPWPPKSAHSWAKQVVAGMARTRRIDGSEW